MAHETTTDTITSIELLLVSMPFDAARRDSGEKGAESIDEFNASSRTFTQMETLMVKVRTAQGLTGWGEGFGHKSNPATWAALEQIVAPFFLGRSTSIEETIPAAQYAFHAFGRTGPIHYALSALDTALWDIAAQRTGKTLREYLSPSARHEVSAYASLVHYAEDPVEVAHHVTRARERGFGAFKLHESTAAAVAGARQAAGDAPLMVDVNCKWDLDGARAAFAELVELNLLWVEEPVFPPDDSSSLLELNREFAAVSAGENHSGVQGLVADMASGALQYAQPSVGKIGGVSAMLEVREAGKALGAAVVPHNFYYGPGLLATAQLIAADPAVIMDNGQQQPELEIPFLNWEETLHPWHAPHTSVMTSQGTVPLPVAPGLGFEPDAQILEKHLVKRVVLEA